LATPHQGPGNGAEELATADSRWSQPVYRESSAISTIWRGKIPGIAGPGPYQTLIMGRHTPDAVPYRAH